MKFTIENTEKALEELREMIKEYNDCDCHIFVGGSGKICPECEKDLKRIKEILSVYDIKHFKPCGKKTLNKKHYCGETSSYAKFEWLCPSCSKIKENLELIRKQGELINE